jgi:hypothetical protein
MLDLIKQIDNAWNSKTELLGIYPQANLGYFNFRNNVISEYNKLHK